MGRPQQPELARSAKTDLDPDHVETGLQGQKAPAAGGETGPVPDENQPGHHPPEEQDKPDLDAFAAKLGADPQAAKATKAPKAPARKATPAKATKATPGKATPAKTGPAKVTPAKRTAAAPAPRPDEAAHIAAPQPEPPGHDEPRLLRIVLTPLRETVKRLDQLDRTLTERLDRKRRR